MYQSYNPTTPYLPPADDLPIHLLAAIFKSKNQSYKLFWFLSILDFVCEDKEVICYDDIMNKMIAKAWYMVMEYHLNLGPADAIEIAINRVRDTSGLAATEKQDKIITFLENTTDSNIKEAKNKLKLNVPYRLQKPFLDIQSSKQWESYEYISNMAAKNVSVLYYYEKVNGTIRIRMNERWISYLKKNEAILRGWVMNELVMYLQRRNPTIPGIPFKIEPPKKRELKQATLFWKTLISHYDIHDCYTDKILCEENFSLFGSIDIDHFIPWSYVASDEVWNLSPTFASVNRSKSNNLPNDEFDLKRLAAQHYQALMIANSNKDIDKLFQKFLDSNLNSEEVRTKLYNQTVTFNEFETSMKTIIHPIYLSARNVGFELWNNREW